MDAETHTIPNQGCTSNHISPHTGPRPGFSMLGRADAQNLLLSNNCIRNYVLVIIGSYHTECFPKKKKKKNVARTAGYEIQRYVFADCRPQYVFPFALAVFFCCVILICVAQWCRCRTAWMRSRLPFRISLTGMLLQVRVRRRAYRRRLVSQSRRLYRSAREVGCSDIFACPTRSP